MLQSFVQWKERYASFGLNRKLAGVLTPGVYEGFELSPGGGMNLLISAAEDYPASVAVIEREGYSVTVRMDSSASIPVPSAGTWYPVIEAYYTPGQETHQQLKVVATPEEHHVVLGRVVVPSGATEIETSHISEEGRTVGSPLLMILGFTAALIGNESELLNYKRRLGNVEAWARHQGYDPETQYSGGGV